MARINQVKGALLEEVILFLLRGSGFQTVTAPDNDATLRMGPAGMLVKGRGSEHQIDAIADFRIGHPFSHPPRLLVEAKAYAHRNSIQLPLIHNAVGVLKDVDEFWNPGDEVNGPNRRRHHYHYALFSTSRFSRDAQEYAFAHDIYLFPVGETAFLHPIVDALENIREAAVPPNLNLRQLREDLRGRLYEDQRLQYDLRDANDYLQPLTEACRRVGKSLLGMLNRSFPVFLVPSDPQTIQTLQAIEDVRIFFDNRGWYLRRRDENVDLFSFDLPVELFNLYADKGILSRAGALNLKAEWMGEIHAYIADAEGGGVRLTTFRLDMGWLQRLREGRNRRQHL